MRVFRVVQLFAVSLLLSNCAYVTAVPAPPGSNVEGIRIYDVKPILIVTETERPAPSAELLTVM